MKNLLEILILRIRIKQQLEKNLFLCCEVLVLMEHSVLAVGSLSKRFCPGREGSDIIPMTLQGSGVVQFLERWQIAANANDTLQRAFILDGGGNW